MILVLARGHYCPKDRRQHLKLAALRSQIAVAYTQIVTISTDNIVETREFRASVGAQWTFLSDAGRKVQKDLDIKAYTDPYHDPMIPHTGSASTACTTATGSGAGRRTKTPCDPDRDPADGGVSAGRSGPRGRGRSHAATTTLGRRSRPGGDHAAAIPRA